MQESQLILLAASQVLYAGAVAMAMWVIDRGKRDKVPHLAVAVIVSLLGFTAAGFVALPTAIAGMICYTLIATVYLALAPKSNAGYLAFKAATRAAREHGSLLPPLHIRNAPTRLMKKLGYGQGYAYDHDAPDRFSGQDYFPDGMARGRYFVPTEEGFEAELKARADRLAKLRRKRGSES